MVRKTNRAMSPEEDLINDIRTIQKMTRRLSSKLVEDGYMKPGSDESRFLSLLNEFYYSMVNIILDQKYFMVDLTGRQTGDAPFGASQGGFLDWVIDHLRPDQS